MSAIQAAIVELEAHCAHVQGVIVELRLLARVVDDAHAPAVTGGPDTKTTTSAPVPTTLTDAMARAKRAPKAAPADVSQTAILQTLRAYGTPVSLTVLIKALGRSGYQLKPHLDALIRLGGVVKSGQTSSTRYALPTKPRSGAGAGTQAAPPVGPPSANGRRAHPETIETVWNGTKERNGEAPSILPPRERKA